VIWFVNRSLGNKMVGYAEYSSIQHIYWLRIWRIGVYLHLISGYAEKGYKIPVVVHGSDVAVYYR